MIEACAHVWRDQLLVLLADELSNLASLQEERRLQGEAIWTSFNATKEDTAWYYVSLREIFRDRLDGTRMFRVYDTLVDEVFTPAERSSRS